MLELRALHPTVASIIMHDFYPKSGTKHMTGLFRKFMAQRAKEGGRRGLVPGRRWEVPGRRE